MTKIGPPKIKILFLFGITHTNAKGTLWDSVIINMKRSRFPFSPLLIILSNPLFPQVLGAEPSS